MLLDPHPIVDRKPYISILSVGALIGTQRHRTDANHLALDRICQTIGSILNFGGGVYSIESTKLND